MLIQCSLPFTVWHRRQFKNIYLCLSFVQIECYDVELYTWYTHMKTYYQKTAGINYLEHMRFDNGFNDTKSRMKQVPVGVEILPVNIIELISATRHISTCITMLHNVSSCHCDIRWSNIIQYYGEWYLIDSEFACHFIEIDLLRETSSRIKQKYGKLSSIGFKSGDY